jgi:hypothetical protein
MTYAPAGCMLTQPRCLAPQAGLMAANGSLTTEQPALEQAFKIMWADHGDDVSRQYAGTGGRLGWCGWQRGALGVVGLGDESWLAASLWTPMLIQA